MSSHPSLTGPLWEPIEEGDQTSRFSGSQLTELVLQSIEASTMFRGRDDAPALETVVAPPPPAASAVAAPGFLAKPAAVLVLPDAPALARPASLPAPPVVAPSLSRSAHSPSRSAIPLPTARRRRAVSAAPVARGGYVRRRLFALGLLGVVVACQPWWWNVGDLHAHPPVTAHAAQR